MAARLPDVLAPRRARTDHTHGLAVQIAGADQPVERVLERTRDATGVLGSGHEHDVGDIDEAPPVLDDCDVLVAAVRVERWDVAQGVEVVDGRSVR